MEKERKILCKENKIKLFLSIFLEGKEEKIYELLSQLGISSESILLYNLNTKILFGNLYYKFNCDVLDKRLIFNGDLMSNDSYPNYIKLIDGEKVSYYAYKKNMIEEIKNPEEGFEKLENTNQVIMYEQRKIKKYIKKFFFNDLEYENRINEILNKLEIKNPISLYFHSFDKQEDFYSGFQSFSFKCNCNSEKNSMLEFKYINKNNHIKEEIILEIDGQVKTYLYDCLFETITEKDKPKSKVKQLDLFRRI